MTKRTTSDSRVDLYADVTNRVIAELEKGADAWRKSWRSAPGLWRPINHSTGRPYRGVNVLLLVIAMQDRGYATNAWVTFKQALDLSGNVRKGAKGVRVMFWRVLGENDDSEVTPEEEQRARMVARHFVVFNVADCESLAAPDETALAMERNGDADAIISASAATIVVGEPAYVPALDVVRLPAATSFDSVDDYYATAMHELSHWTGPRVGRELNSKRWGDDAYAIEELVAELSAAMLCGHCGIPAISQSAAYLDHWLKVLKADKRAIFSVASLAQKAADFLIARADECTDACAAEAAQ